MFIDSVTISSFGKLKNCTFEFSDGLNLIYGLNESGKTTLFSFIKFIFYGMNLRKRNGELSFKEKYLPWDGSSACGNLTFTDDDGKKYIIFRFFSKDKSSVKICNAITMEEVNKFDIKKLGECFIKLNEEAFSNTSFLSGLSSNVKTDRDGELVKRLVNLSQSGSEDISFTNAFNKLKEEISAFSSERRKNSIIPSLKMNINTLNDEIFRYNKEVLRVDELKKKLEDLNTEISKLKDEKKKINLSAICNSNTHNNAVDGVASEIYALRKSEFLRFTSVSDEEKNLIDKYENINKIKFSLYVLVSFCLCIVFFTFVVTKNIFFIIAILCAMLLCIYLFITKINKTALKAKNIFKRYNCENVKDFKKNINFCENISLRIRILEDELNILKSKSDNVIECKKTSNDFTITENNDKIEMLDDKISVLMRDVISTEEQLQTCLYAMVKLEDLKKEKEILENNLSEAYRKLDALNWSCEILQIAFDELKKQFAPQLSQQASKVLAQITNNKHDEMYTDDQFNVKLKSDVSFNDSLFYSRGTYEQIYFSMRIALLNIAVSDKKLPLFVDDAFGFYDDIRLSNTLDFIFNESKNRQIFISSCHIEEHNYFKNKNVNIIELCSERND